MSKKKIFLAITGYIASLAIAAKFRKDKWTSKLADDTKKSTLQNIADEFVDIHRSAYDGVKNFVVENFNDVKDVDTLKNKINTLVRDFADNIEITAEKIQHSSADKIEHAKKFIEENYKKARESMKNAEEKIKSFTEDSEESTKEFISEAKNSIEAKYKEAKEKLSTK